MATMIDTPAPLPRVLVLMATYNGALWLREQLDSILSQQGVEVQILVGDDCSRDTTRTVVVEHAEQGARIRVVGWDQSSGSAGANFRRLYRFVPPGAAFDFVALADQDDLWAPDKILSAVQALQTSGCDGYSCSVRAFQPDGHTWTLSQSARTRRTDFLFEGAGQGCTFVLSWEMFLRIGQFCRQQARAVEALHYHDWLVYLLVRAWGGRWYFDPVPHMDYRQHGGNEIGARGGVAAVWRRLPLLRDGWFARQVEAALQLWVLAGGQDAMVDEVGRLMRQNTAVSRIRLALLVAAHSRRRWGDRAVLVVAALAGWMHPPRYQA